MYNYALLCALTPADMAGARSVPALAFEHFRGTAAGRLIELVSVVVCLGAISACMLANVRIPYALARDGLAFRSLGRMSARQAPVGALMISGGIACCFVLNRSFGQILRIYFLASALLFGLTYLSLIVFRLRDRRAGRAFPANVYKTPAGIVQACLLIGLEIAIAASILRSDWQRGTRDSLYTLALLAGLAALYAVWRSPRVRSR
ncbi:MAG: amino acid permease [Phycisphaerae bacterium]